MTAATDSAFNQVIAAWDEPLRCGAITTLSGQCRRKANWRLNFHGCEQELLCGHHLNAWKKQVVAVLISRLVCCGMCGKSFDRFERVCSITRL